MNKLSYLIAVAFIALCPITNAAPWTKKPKAAATATPTPTPSDRKRVLVVPAAYKDSEVVVLGSDEYNELLNNKKVAEIVIITNIVKETVSELGCNIYDFSTWEYLADQYAARHGAGRYLATGLEKTYKSIGDISFRSTSNYLAMEALKVFLIITIPVNTPFSPKFPKVLE